ncbi:putative PGM2-phosphoglucomutase [Multifurca ochricompacta]|uniref:phosphoglucomutase (alpha-D-glucose-1,6-bisphosphate-dependent) n=1 Tax=Multifurca ochricompacta TaxID=376703 RepID=A0AAD4M8Q6_9AGAM|nr:putative PGM2-phosphoglucomutase [Multifurca ochricompacta]
MSVKEIPTKPFDGQKPGTSGSTLVIGGDGRFYSPEVVQIILKIASANGVSKLIIGKDGILSTPAASNIIRKFNANGGILLTASHNPGGPNADFGIKYNVENGGPAPESITEKIFAKTKIISSYKVIEAPPVEISKLGDTVYGPLKVSVIDSVKDYLELLETIFDFGLIKSFLTSHKSDFKILFDGLHGVTGPYAKAIFLKTLGLPESSVQHCEPSPDFGGGHPDPNLTYARSLVEVVERDNIPFGAASDGDGDRNMIYGAGAFVTPSDSVAIIADWAEAIPYFKKGGIKGLARSMPTSAAIDLVAKAKGLEYFEVPTESFGTGSDHIREKDGLWAVVAWLNIIAAANEQEKSGKLWGIREILNSHYAKYGRSFFSRYDYEEVPSEGAQKLVDRLNELIKSSSFSGKLYTSSGTGTTFAVANAYNFDYTDPIDKSVSKNQGQVVTFSDGSRVVWRLSGTGSQGATVRMYVERYVAPGAGEKELSRNTGEGLSALIDVALEISNLKIFLGREEPTVITVSAIGLSPSARVVG